MTAQFREILFISDRRLFSFAGMEYFPIFAHEFKGSAPLMATPKTKGKKGKWYDRLRNKYRLVFMNDETLEERFTFRLSRLNVFIALGTLTIVLIFLTIHTDRIYPLREYIPGIQTSDCRKTCMPFSERQIPLKRRSSGKTSLSRI